MFSFSIKNWKKSNHIEQDVMNQTEEKEVKNLDSIGSDTFSSDYLLNSSEAVGWTSTELQELLFSVLTIFYDPGSSVLDVGCGRADLANYLLNNNYIDSSKLYKGIDSNPNILEVAKKKYPGVNVENSTIESLSTSQSDWVFASGVFNLIESDDMTKYLTDSVDKMYQASKKGIAFNILTEFPKELTKEEQAQMATYDVGSWTNFFVKKYSKVIVRTDYLEGDATFFIFK